MKGDVTVKACYLKFCGNYSARTTNGAYIQRRIGPATKELRFSSEFDDSLGFFDNYELTFQLLELLELPGVDIYDFGPLPRSEVFKQGIIDGIQAVKIE